MTDKTLQTTSQSSVVKPPEPNDKTVYWDSSYERCWEISLNFKTKFYLTEEEMLYYVEQLKRKKRIVLVGGIILGNKFDYISKIRVSKPSYLKV